MCGLHRQSRILSTLSNCKGQRFLSKDVNRLFQIHQIMWIREMQPQSTAQFTAAVMNLVYFFGSSCFTPLQLNMDTLYCLTTTSQ